MPETALALAKENYLNACAESNWPYPSPQTPQEYITHWESALSESDLIDRLNREASLKSETDALALAKRLSDELSKDEAIKLIHMLIEDKELRDSLPPELLAKVDSLPAID